MPRPRARTMTAASRDGTFSIISAETDRGLPDANQSSRASKEDLDEFMAEEELSMPEYVKSTAKPKMKEYIHAIDTGIPDDESVPDGNDIQEDETDQDGNEMSSSADEADGA